MDFFKRRRKEFKAPPPPPPELVEKVRAAEETAEIQLQHATAREADIDARAEHTEQIRRENALGPRFWLAVGQHRGS